MCIDKKGACWHIGPDGWGSVTAKQILKGYYVDRVLITDIYSVVVCRGNNSLIVNNSRLNGEEGGSFDGHTTLLAIPNDCDIISAVDAHMKGLYLVTADGHVYMCTICNGQASLKIIEFFIDNPVAIKNGSQQIRSALSVV